MTADLTPAQAARLEAIEAAPYAEEALVSRIANAAHTAACDCGDEDVTWSRYWQQIAVAAIDVMRGAADDGAVGRCGAPEPTLTGERAGYCALPAGHAGWHRSDADSEWIFGAAATAEGDRRG